MFGKFDHGPRKPVFIKPDKLKEALQAAVAGTGPGGAGKLAGDMGQIDGPGIDQTDHQTGQASPDATCSGKGGAIMSR